MILNLIRAIVLFSVGITLVGCTAGSDPSAATLTAIQAALASGCPIVTAIQNAKAPLNTYQTSALNVLALACPPNPPPNSGSVVVTDILSAYAILKPLIK